MDASTSDPHYIASTDKATEDKKRPKADQEQTLFNVRGDDSFKAAR